MTRRSFHKRAAQKRWQRIAPGFLCGRSKMARERRAYLYATDNLIDAILYVTLAFKAAS